MLCACDGANTGLLEMLCTCLEFVLVLVLVLLLLLVLSTPGDGMLSLALFNTGEGMFPFVSLSGILVLPEGCCSVLFLGISMAECMLCFYLVITDVNNWLNL